MKQTFSVPAKLSEFFPLFSLNILPYFLICFVFYVFLFCLIFIKYTTKMQQFFSSGCSHQDLISSIHSVSPTLSMSFFTTIINFLCCLPGNSIFKILFPIYSLSLLSAHLPSWPLVLAASLLRLSTSHTHAFCLASTYLQSSSLKCMPLPLRTLLCLLPTDHLQTS